MVDTLGAAACGLIVLLYVLLLPGCQLFEPARSEIIFPAEMAGGPGGKTITYKSTADAEVELRGLTEGPHHGKPQIESLVIKRDASGATTAYADALMQLERARTENVALLIGELKSAVSELATTLTALKLQVSTAGGAAAESPQNLRQMIAEIVAERVRAELQRQAGTPAPPSAPQP